jgi:hypothetical protein
MDGLLISGLLVIPCVSAGTLAISVGSEVIIYPAASVCEVQVQQRQTVDSESLSIKTKAIAGTLMSSIQTIIMVHLCVPPLIKAIERGR